MCPPNRIAVTRTTRICWWRISGRRSQFRQASGRPLQWCRVNRCKPTGPTTSPGGGKRIPPARAEDLTLSRHPRKSTPTPDKEVLMTHSTHRRRVLAGGAAVAVALTTAGLAIGPSAAGYGEAVIEPVETDLAGKDWVTARATSNDSDAGRALDGDESTAWRRAASTSDSRHGKRDQALTVDLGGAYDGLHKVEVVLADATPARYVVEASADGKRWTTLADHRDGRSGAAGTTALVDREGTRYLRVRFTSARPGANGVGELQVFNYLRDDLSLGADLSWMDDARTSSTGSTPWPRTAAPGRTCSTWPRTVAWSTAGCGSSTSRAARAPVEPTPIPRQGPERSLASAEWIKHRDMGLGIDFHYADSWADPSKQPKPRAWAELEFDDLSKAVYDFTADYLTRHPAGHHAGEGRRRQRDHQRLHVRQRGGPHRHHESAVLRRPGRHLPVEARRWPAVEVLAVDRPGGATALRPVVGPVHHPGRGRDQGRPRRVTEIQGRDPRDRRQGPARQDHGVLAPVPHPGEGEGPEPRCAGHLVLPGVARYARGAGSQPATPWPPRTPATRSTSPKPPTPPRRRWLAVAQLAVPRTIQGQADAIQRVFQAANDVVGNRGSGALVWEPAGCQPMFRAVPGRANTWEPHASINVFNASRAKHILQDTVHVVTAVDDDGRLPRRVDVLTPADPPADGTSTASASPGRTSPTTRPPGRARSPSAAPHPTARSRRRSTSCPDRP